MKTDAVSAADEQMLDSLQRAAFDYFLKHAHLRTGLVTDTSRAGSPASIAAVGFALSAYPVAVEHGWMAREDAVQRSLAALRFFWASDQSGRSGVHRRAWLLLSLSRCRDRSSRWQSELSSIDTALLIMGMLTAAAYFDAPSPDETELRRLASALYDRVGLALGPARRRCGRTRMEARVRLPELWLAGLQRGHRAVCPGPGGRPPTH